jgi:hypothetical protein
VVGVHGVLGTKCDAWRPFVLLHWTCARAIVPVCMRSGWPPLLGDMAALAVAVGGGEGGGGVVLVHMVAREVWGGVGRDPGAVGCVLGVARYLPKVGRPGDVHPCSWSFFGTVL